jgi:hypothetical protein
MAFFQGIYFRSTDNQVDPTGYDVEVGNTVNYPRNPDAGDSTQVGWEDVGGGVSKADRSGTDVRFAGIHFRSNSGTAATYRIDLPATGEYRVRVAAGDASAQQILRCQLIDDTTTFVDIGENTITSTNWFDASNTLRTSESDWTTNNVAATRTFTSTIFRIKIGERLGGTSGNSTIAFVEIEATAVPGEEALTGSASTGGQTAPSLTTSVPL